MRRQFGNWVLNTIVDRDLSGQLARFGFVGVVGAVCDVGGTMLLLTHGWSPLAARVPALATAIAIMWTLHGMYTFRRRAQLTGRSFFRFATVAGAVALLNYGLYGVMVVLGLWPPLAIVVATGICTCVSYLAYRFIVFR